MKPSIKSIYPVCQPDTRFIIYRDVAVYVPNAVNDKVYYQWGVSGYGYINKIHADVLLLSKQHLRDYTQAGHSNGG